MKKLIASHVFGTFFLLFPLSMLRAQTGAVAQTNATAAAQTLLWKISGHGLAQESYMLITTNNTCEDKVVISNKIRTVLEKVKAVMTETGATNPANNEKAQKLWELKNDNQSARNVLSPELYGQLKQKAEEMGVDELYLNQYTLFYLNLRLTLLAMDCKLPKSDRIEDEIRDYCKKNNLPMGELLSTEELYALYDDYPKAYWERSISLLLRNPDKVRQNFDVKAAFYKQENFPGLQQVCAKGEYFGIRFAFTTKETTRMLLLFTRTEKAIKDQPVLITMDASEVANDNTSLFALLSNAGYTISPVLN